MAKSAPLMVIAATVAPPCGRVRLGKYMPIQCTANDSFIKLFFVNAKI